MSESKRLLKNTGLIAIGNTSTKIVSFLLLPLYTTILTKEEYGVIDYFFSITAFCIPFVNLLMDESIFRFLLDCKTKEERTKVISSTVFVVLIGIVLLCICSLPFIFLKHIPYLELGVVYVTISSISSIESALLRGIGRTDQFTLYNFCSSVLHIILNVLFIAYLMLGINGMLFAAAISTAVVCIVFFMVLDLKQYISFKSIDTCLIKEMVIYSLPLIPNKLSWNIINLSNRIIVMNTIGSSATGLFAIANKFPGLLDTIYGFFYQAWKESSARVTDDDNKEQFFNGVYKYLKDFLYSMVLLLIAFMPVIFGLLVNKSYHDALLYVPFLLIGTYFSNISGFYGGIFTAYKDTKIMGNTTVVAALINISLNLLAIKYFGLWAASLAVLVSTFVVYQYRKIKVARYVKLEENFKDQIFTFIFTCLLLILYYSNNIKLLVLAMMLAVIHSIVVNRNLIRYLLMFVRKRFLKGC